MVLIHFRGIAYEGNIDSLTQDNQAADMINHSYIKTTNNRINFIAYITNYFRDNFISE